MGYLNTQLEKIASVVEVEMEKQALTIADIVRMGGKAVDEGKALHFAKRLTQRNKALANQFKNRRLQVSDAIAKLGPALDLEHGYGIVGPNRKELYRLLDRQPSQLGSLVEALASPNIDKSVLEALKPQIRYRAALEPITPRQLAGIVKNLRSIGGSLV